SFAAPSCAAMRSKSRRPRPPPDAGFEMANHLCAKPPPRALCPDPGCWFRAVSATRSGFGIARRHLAHPVLDGDEAAFLRGPALVLRGQVVLDHVDALPAGQRRLAFGAGHV